MRNVILQRNINAWTAHIRRVIRETLIHIGQAIVVLNGTFVTPAERALSIIHKRNDIYQKMHVLGKEVKD